jgi:hypothetical protein
MTLTRTQRRWLAGAMLVTGAAAALWENGGEPAGALAQTERLQPVQRNRAPVAALPELELEKLELARSPEPIANAFEPRSWIPPPLKIMLGPPPPPPPPQAPPLPYIYIGKMMDAGEIVVFLANRERNYSVRSGDKLDDLYQVNDIKPTMMVLTYLPLNLQQSLMIGSAN